MSRVFEGREGIEVYTCRYIVARYELIRMTMMTMIMNVLHKTVERGNLWIIIIS